MKSLKINSMAELKSELIGAMNLLNMPTEDDCNGQHLSESNSDVKHSMEHLRNVLHSLDKFEIIKD